MADKMLICRCEDVTLHDVEEALERGYRDIESVKRYTGFGTGFCQGKQCIALCARVIRARTGEAPAVPFTRAAAVQPRPALASRRAARRGGAGVTAAGTGAVALPESADVVVIGGGIMGLATAYHLALLGVERIVVRREELPLRRRVGAQRRRRPRAVVERRRTCG